MEEIINKVAASGLVTIDLEEMYPAGECVELDIAPLLWQGLALKEKDFREWISQNDWSVYQGKHVAYFCSADAIIQPWAFMLVASRLSELATTAIQGRREELESALFRSVIDMLDLEQYRDKRCVIKGCSNKPVPASAYAYLVTHLQPVAKSIMFGEPCSTVPVFKKA
jgi:hypothetical protein